MLLLHEIKNSKPAYPHLFRMCAEMAELCLVYLRNGWRLRPVNESNAWYYGNKLRNGGT